MQKEGRGRLRPPQHSRAILLAGAFIRRESRQGCPSTIPATPQGTVQADLVHSVTKERTASSLFFGSSLSHSPEPISKQILLHWLQCIQNACPAHLLCPKAPKPSPLSQHTLLPCVPSSAQSFPNCKLDHNAHVLKTQPRLSHSRQNPVPSFGLHYYRGHLPTLPCWLSCLRHTGL